MYYAFPLKIPANTPKTVPIEQVLNLTWGVITHVAIRFPPNCAGLANIMIMEHRHQLWPTNLDEWFYGDDETIQWHDHHEVLELPARFTLLGYNLDDTYPHTPIVRFEILHPLIALGVAGGGLGMPGVSHIEWEDM